jgi:hypothetical protein
MNDRGNIEKILVELKEDIMKNAFNDFLQEDQNLDKN